MKAYDINGNSRHIMPISPRLQENLDKTKKWLQIGTRIKRFDHYLKNDVYVPVIGYWRHDSGIAKNFYHCGVVLQDGTMLDTAYLLEEWPLVVED